MDSETLAVLREAADGLLFPSETDAPFEVFYWEVAENSAASILRFAPRMAGEPMRTLSLSDFLQDLDEEKEFHALREALEKTLIAIIVYRFGTVHPTYFIVGNDADGNLAGLKTKAVET